MMPLSVAMAMSGLDADEFNEFKEIYNHGVALIDNNNKSKLINRGVRPSSSSSSGSCASTTTTTSTENGIELSMLMMEHPMTCIYNNNNNNSNNDAPHRCPSFDLNMNEYKKCCDNNSSATNFNQINNIKETDLKEFKNDELKIMYENRNILDLANNLKKSCQVNFARLEGGVNCFFENRSQLSRLANLEPPLHRNYTCTHTDCKFVIPHYF